MLYRLQVQAGPPPSARSSEGSSIYSSWFLVVSGSPWHCLAGSSSISVSASFYPVFVYGHQGSPPLFSRASFFTWLYPQRPYWQINSRSEVPGARTWEYIWVRVPDSTHCIHPLITEPCHFIWSLDLQGLESSLKWNVGLWPRTGHSFGHSMPGSKNLNWDFCWSSCMRNLFLLGWLWFQPCP